MSKIEWTNRTWNPLRARNKATGGIGHFCEKVSAGCRGCYAERWQPRNKNFIKFSEPYLEHVEIYLDEEVLLRPLHWKKPRKIFGFDMTDLFGHWVKEEWLDKIFAVMGLCPQHTFQILTKRPERMKDYINHDTSKRISAVVAVNVARLGLPDCRDEQEHLQWPIKNIWLGVSCENQQTADERIPFLIQTPAAVRFLSCEPLLGEIDLEGFLPPNERFERPKIDWVITGGESGPGARPMHPDWVRSLRDQCDAAGVKFFFKQWGEWIPLVDIPEIMPSDDWLHKTSFELNQGFVNQVTMKKLGKKASGHLLDGVEHHEFPKTEKL